MFFENRLFMKIKNVKQKIINKYNIYIVIFLGQRWKLILINEFPKCGGSWLKNMLCDILEEDGYVINKHENYVPPIKPKYIMQRHWLKNYKYPKKTIILLRDPRDAYNSFYFFENYYSSTPVKKKLFQYNEKDNDQENMYRYLRVKLLRPEKSTPGFSYKAFWETVKKESGVHFVRYENLRENPFSELKKMLDYLEVNKSDASITKAIENQSILKMQAREKVKDERQRFARKGIVGDWKSNFNSNSKDLTKSELGDILIEMGYEKDENW
jgi:hypothetical protein